jgi:perosamine synthetase
MLPRGQLDITPGSLLSTVARGLLMKESPADVAQRVEDFWSSSCLPSSTISPATTVVAALSVRSGLDAVLKTVAWPAGSEILMSAINLPQMSAIIREHGYMPVPVDVSPDTLAPDPRQMADRITPRTRALLVAQLFGSRLDVSPLATIAHSRGIELWEDLAQAFQGLPQPGPVTSDLRLFSFGTIKRATALGGGLLEFRDPQRAAACRQVLAQWPVQSSSRWQRRVRLALLLRLASLHGPYTVLTRLTDLCGIELDQQLSQAVRGFSPDCWLGEIRQRPCGQLLRLLERRLKAFNPDRDNAWRVRLGRCYRTWLPESVLVGRLAEIPVPWVLPVRSRDPSALRSRLWQAGFDATVLGSQIKVIPPAECRPEWTTPLASGWLPQLIYLPLHPAVTERHIQTMAGIVREAET